MVPEKWLEDPELIDRESTEMRSKAWSIVWSIFRRDGAFHPDDNEQEMGDQEGELQSPDGYPCPSARGTTPVPMRTPDE